MPVSKFSVSLSPDATKQIESRPGDRSSVITQCLERYYNALAYSRRKLSDLLSVGEISAVLDALNGVAMLDAWSPAYIQQELADGIELNGLDAKWKIEGKALVKKLAALDYIDKCALADAAERWWGRVGDGENPKPDEALK